MTYHRRIPGTRPGALRILAVATALATAPVLAASHEADAPADGATSEDAVTNAFSPDMSGPWTGGGEVLRKIGDERPLTVSCDFTMDATDATLDLNGECGALFIKRPIRVSLTRENNTISGTYEAELRTGPARLEGSEDSGVIEMDVEWGGEVNGDLEAEMRIMGSGPEGLRIVFTDINPATGEERTTSNLVLERG